MSKVTVTEKNSAEIYRGIWGGWCTIGKKSGMGISEPTDFFKYISDPTDAMLEDLCRAQCDWSGAIDDLSFRELNIPKESKIWSYIDAHKGRSKSGLRLSGNPVQDLKFIADVGELGVVKTSQLFDDSSNGSSAKALLGYVENNALESLRISGIMLAYFYDGFGYGVNDGVQPWRYARDLDDNISYRVVDASGNLLKFVSLDEELHLTAVSQNGNAICYIMNPSDRVKLTAVMTNGEAIRFIDNPSEELCLEAVRQNGLSLKYIKTQSNAVVETALQQNPGSLQYVVNPVIKTRMFASEVQKQKGVGDVDYRSGASQGSNDLSANQVALMNWCLENLRSMLYVLTDNKPCDSRLYEKEGYIYVESGKIRMRMNSDGDELQVQGIKLDNKSKEKVRVFVYKTVERILSKVAMPVKSVSFPSGLNSLGVGRLVKSKEVGSVEMVLR